MGTPVFFKVVYITTGVFIILVAGFLLFKYRRNFRWRFLRGLLILYIITRKKKNKKQKTL